MYGKVPTHAMTVNVYSLDNQLVRSFSSQVACAKWLDVSEGTVRLYVKSGKVFRKQYLIVRSSVGAPVRCLLLFLSPPPPRFAFPCGARAVFLNLQINQNNIYK